MVEKAKNASEILFAIVEKLGTNMRAFALGMNEPYSKIFDISRGKTLSFSARLVKSIRDTYGINEEFIRTGKGEILQSEVLAVPQVSDEITASFLKVISTYSNENAALKEEITQLKSRIAELEQQLLEKSE